MWLLKGWSQSFYLNTDAKEVNSERVQLEGSVKGGVT